MRAMKSILCVDDQEAGLEIRKLLLESLGYSVITVATGAEAVETLRREPVDLAILDYRLADATGEEVANLLKHDHPELPILLLSGYPSVPESARAAVDAFVVKGDPTDAFLRTIESLLASPAAAPAAQPVISTPSGKKGKKIVERSEELMKRSEALYRRLTHRKYGT